MFIPSTGILILNGIGKTITGNTTFNRVTVYGSYIVSNNDISYNGKFMVTSGASYDSGNGVATVSGDFIITNGNFIAGNNTHKLAGDWIMTGGTFNNTSSTIQLNGLEDQDIYSIGAFNNLQLNKPIGITTLSSNVTVNTGLILTLGKCSIGKCYGETIGL